jgi:hypothetical protein
MPAVTADPSQYPEHRAPSWYVHTDQGVVLAGPHPDEQTARAQGNRVAAEIHAGMRREGHPEPAIAERVRALRVSLGTTEPPHGGFRPGDQHSSESSATTGTTHATCLPTTPATGRTVPYDAIIPYGRVI